MNPHHFGTDGVRAPFGEAPLVAPEVRRLGRALAAELGGPDANPEVVLGGDTRDSTPLLAAWLAAGIRSGGGRVTFLGTVPTPAVARAVASGGAAAGAVISASHNPWPDNGIKLIDRDGYKWESRREAELERLWDEAEDPGPEDDPQELPVDPAGAEAWRAALVASTGGPGALAGLRIAVDCGHGAASAWAGGLLADLGADAVVAYDAPDGRNVNDGCGSTEPQVIADLVRESGADLGFSFDGDADRVVVCDSSGRIHDGDAILLLWARDLDDRGELPGRAIVATSMSNLGLEVALERSGLSLVRCGVGDREVVATLRERGLDLGGEQSGHVVRLALSTTGDGLLTALQVAAIVHRSGRSLEELLADFRRFPQVLQGVRVASKPSFDSLPEVASARNRVLESLGDRGRLVLRYSGTEPLARIMLEGPDEAEIQRLAGELATAIRREIGAAEEREVHP